MVSDCPEQVEDLVCQDMLGLGQHTLRQARRVYPDWFD